MCTLLHQYMLSSLIITIYRTAAVEVETCDVHVCLVILCPQIIPIEGDFEVNDEPQKTFKEILPEIVISK